VIGFWRSVGYSQSEPCKTESPHLQAVSERQKKHGVQFVGIDIKDEKQAALAFVDDFGVTYPIVYDEPARSALQIGNLPTRGLPTTVVIDKLGRVAAIYTGALFEADIEPVVMKLAAEA
jgi:peroxiredoxin